MKKLDRMAGWKRSVAVSFLGLWLAVAGSVFGQTSWTKYGGPVMTRGADGQFDDERIIPNTVIHQDAVYKMWYSGFDGWYYTIGYAVSPDGIHWTKHNGPVLDLGSSGGWDSYEVRTPIVYYDGSLYRIWYRGGNGAFDELGYAEMGYATSADGINWTKYDENPVMIPGPSGKWVDLTPFCRQGEKPVIS